MDVPPSLKSLSPFIRLSKQFEARDPVVSYYCQLYFVQNGIKIAGKDDESKTYLFGVMDRLEQVKKILIEQGNEAVANDIVASSHIESSALQLFIFADREDRASNFSVKVIKAFYTASLLFDLISMFGELSDEVAHQQKYAKWKATYLERCRKTGEEPLPGPQRHDDEQPGPSGSEDNNPQPSYDQSPQPGHFQPPQPSYSQPPQPSYTQPAQPSLNHAGPSSHDSYNQPVQPAYSQATFEPPASSFTSQPAQPAYNPPPLAQPYISGVTKPGQTEMLQLDLNQHVELSYDQIEKVQKLCRFASSALNYHDAKSCLDNLQKAINLIRLGREN